MIDLADARHAGFGYAPVHRLELVEIGDLERKLVHRRVVACSASGNEHDLMVMIGRRGQERELPAEPVAHPAVCDHEAQDVGVEVDLLRDVADVNAAVRQHRIDR